MSKTCYLVVLRDNAGKMQVVGGITEDFEEAVIARDAAGDATGCDNMIVAFDGDGEASDFANAFKDDVVARPITVG